MAARFQPGEGAESDASDGQARHRAPPRTSWEMEPRRRGRVFILMWVGYSSQPRQEERKGKPNCGSLGNGDRTYWRREAASGRDDLWKTRDHQHRQVHVPTWFFGNPRELHLTEPVPEGRPGDQGPHAGGQDPPHSSDGLLPAFAQGQHHRRQERDRIDLAAALHEPHADRRRLDLGRGDQLLQGGTGRGIIRPSHGDSVRGCLGVATGFSHSPWLSSIPPN